MSLRFGLLYIYCACVTLFKFDMRPCPATFLLLQYVYFEWCLNNLGADVEQPYMYVQMQRRSTTRCVIPALYHVVKKILKPFKLSFQMSDSSPLIYRRRRPIAPDPEPQLDVSKTSSRGNRIKKKRKTKAVVALRKKTSTRRHQRQTLSPSFAYSLFNS